MEQIIDIPVPHLGGRSVAQNVDTPVLRGRGIVSGSGLQGFRPGQSSSAVAEHIVSPVPSRGGARGGLHGFLPRQSSSAVSEQTVSPAPRREGSRGGVQGFSPGQGSISFPPERISERIMEQNVDILGGGGVQGFLTRQSSAALSEQVPVSAVHAATAPVVEFMASAPAVHAAPAPVGEFMASAPSVHAAPAPVGEFMASAPSVHAAPGSSGDDASRVEQDIDVEGWIIWAEWFITRGPA